ncbi:MAG: hypothetical protein OXG43_06145 [Chloroflexi bacterium]|nr:hypothetical protein [Chloroflexota bacterium]
MATSAGRRVLTRRMALAAIMIGGGAVACGEAQPQPIAARLRPYWEPALEVATGSLDVLRALSINSNAFARGSLSTDQFLLSVEAQWPSISALSQLVIPLGPAPDDQETHTALVAVVDALVEIGPTVRGYRETEQPERLMHLVTLQQRVREQLGAFIEGIGPGLAQDGLRARLEAIGESTIEAWRVRKRAVLVGPYQDEAAARASLAHIVDDLRLSPTNPGWVEVARFADPAAADAAAGEWLLRGVQVRVEDVIDLTFNVTTHRAPERQSWRELLWLERLDFDPTHLAASELGEQVVAVARSGKVASFGADGGLRWTRDMRMPLARVSMQRHGELLAVHGFDVQLLNLAGNQVWPSPFRPDNQLLEQALFDDEGTRLVVRSTNASGVGRVFAFNRQGQVWGPTKSYISAASVDLDKRSGSVAVGSSNRGENQVVLIRPDGNLQQRFGVDGDILQVIFTQEGDQVITLTSAGLQVFEAESANIRTQLRFPATAAARAPRDDILILAGEAGVGSFTLDGTEVWFTPRVRARAVYPMNDYVAALVDDMTITVIRSDGAVLGDATTLAAIRGVAVAPGLNRLFAVSAERQLQAWQLPPVAIPPQG